MNRVISVRYPSGNVVSIAYAYNANDQLASITYPRSGQVVHFNPNALGRPTTASGYVTAATYWPSGQLQQVTYGNGVVTTYGQNSRLWPSSLATRKGGSTYVDSSYSYDGVGNLTAIADKVDRRWPM